MDTSKLELLEKEISQLKESLARKEAVEQALEEIAIQFIKPSNQNEAFDFALQKLLELSICDRAVIMQVNADDPSLISMTHEKCRKGLRKVARYAQNLHKDENSWFEKVYKEQAYIVINDTSQLPDEAQNEKKLFKRHKIRAALISSFASNNEFRGNLHLELNKPTREWPGEIIRMVVFIAVLIEHSIGRSESNQKLITEKERAEQSDKMKSAFMANLSHEIRTPLNGIMGFTKLMTSNRYNEKKKAHYGKLIEKSSIHLLSIIDDLIDLSRIESGSMKMIGSTINVRDTVLGVYETFIHELPPNRDLQLKLDLPYLESKLSIKTDSRRLRQILDNLMKNAIRYTPAGVITLGYRTRKNQVEFFVSDTGIGIHKKDLPFVFNRFWQVDHSQARNYGGSGLGLSISKDFATMLGGDLHVKSKSGKGSEFILVLPQ
ncbi:MAG: GAF domain-containing sensor histidine kinase [Bacteroidales bacterium]|nr:GAF domain-containing sensor histidine kinase [Bacteroidales bacterium]